METSYHVSGQNKLGLKSIGDLVGMSFFIPRYQRGYRWTNQQVLDLLDDINEFHCSGKDGFYCLQPLVVKQREEDILSKIRQADSIEEVMGLLQGNWEVIDGQQRLTTIYIILGGLGVIDLYSLAYETRPGSGVFLKNMEESKRWSNIDYHYMMQAKDTVDRWIKDGLNSEKEKSAFLETFKTKVKFIWYESVEENPIRVFTRLNIGKIALANSELIKALFLNGSNFEDGFECDLMLTQREIASEWDEIEYTLQNDEFWMFLHDKGYNRPTRIDFILDLICDKNIFCIEKFKEQKEMNRIIGMDGYRTFRYFYEYFKSLDSTMTRQQRTKKAWMIIKSYYRTFKEWFDDLELYHYMGFLLICGKQEISLGKLIEEWINQSSKKIYLSFIKSKIKDVIGPITLKEQYKEDGSDKRKCLPILLFHNIQTVINQNYAQQKNERYKMSTFYKFPFHLYKLEGWDVEHINSSTSNQETDEDTRREWLLNVYMSADSNMKEKIDKYFDESDTRASTLFEEIKKAFPEPEVWTQAEKNQIGNYTLLDSSTNRSYGNVIFSAKRRIIIGKDQGCLIPVPKLKDGRIVFGKPESANSSFVPPCTKQVFLKYFSSTVGNNNYWTTNDARAYIADINKCLEQLNENSKEDKQ